MFENPLSISRMAGSKNFCLFGRDTEISENPSELHAEQNKSNVSIESSNIRKQKEKVKQRMKLQYFAWPLYV